MCKTIHFIAAIILFAGPALSQPTDLTFKRARKNSDLTFKNCALVEGVQKITITNRGRKVNLPPAEDREAVSLPERYRFFACGVDPVSSVVTLYAKDGLDGEVTSFVFSLADFPVDETPGPNCRDLPGSHIYKTIGSEHFHDIRRNTIGLIVKPGGSGPFPSCIEAKDIDGNVIAKLSLYERGNGWAARYYAGIGCGRSTPFNGNGVGSRAKKNTGTTDIILDFGSVCYGPIDASRCIGSKQC